MFIETNVSKHYTHGNLLGAIQESLGKLGKTSDNVGIEDLAPVDEFHIGGRKATEHFLNQLDIMENDHILDVGCGLGGAARYIAKTYKSQVTGIDLTQEYIDTGRVLNAWVGLENQVDLFQGSALSMPFENEIFTGALMLHVGMNIENKNLLFSELYRVLKPGSFLGIYDIMRINDGQLSYPVPWSTVESTSNLSSPDQYKKVMSDAGFSIVGKKSRSVFAIEFFNDLQSRIKLNGGPPPLGLHTLMGASTMQKIQNMIGDIVKGLTAPIEIIAVKKWK